MSLVVQRSNLNVLHIGAGRYRPYDTGHATFGIWRELAKGFRRYTVVGRSTAPETTLFEDGGVSVHLLASRMESEAEFLLTQFLAGPMACEASVDVIITQCPVQGGLVAASIAKRIGARVLMEFHMSHYFEKKPFPSRNGVLEMLTRLNLPHANRIRVLSKGMREKLLEKYGKKYESKLVVLPPRVDLARFSHVKNVWDIKGRPKVVMVGSVTHRKGQLRFLQTVLPSKLDIEIWIVGTGSDLDLCKSLSVKVGAEDRVKFFGQMSHAELADLLPCADVMVLFSNMEGTPRVLMEGMAVGLPIITTNAGFCADVIENEIQGIVLGGNPAAEIVERLDQLFTDDEFRACLGRAARVRAEVDFAADKLYNRYRALIRETAEV